MHMLQCHNGWREMNTCCWSNCCWKFWLAMKNCCCGGGCCCCCCCCCWGGGSDGCCCVDVCGCWSSCCDGPSAAAMLNWIGPQVVAAVTSGGGGEVSESAPELETDADPPPPISPSPVSRFSDEVRCLSCTCCFKKNGDKQRKACYRLF